jgi:hypothetical protein
MLEDLKNKLPKSWVIPCEHGRWLHCDSLNRAILFNHDNIPIRMCGKKEDRFFSMDIEIVSKESATNLFNLITNPSSYKFGNKT